MLPDASSEITKRSTKVPADDKARRRWAESEDVVTYVGIEVGISFCEWATSRDLGQCLPQLCGRTFLSCLNTAAAHKR
jgi:hypothetical protein